MAKSGNNGSSGADAPSLDELLAQGVEEVSGGAGGSSGPDDDFGSGLGVGSGDDIGNLLASDDGDDGAGDSDGDHGSGGNATPGGRGFPGSQASAASGPPGG